MSWADRWRRFNRPSLLLIFAYGGIAVAGAIGMATGAYYEDGKGMVIIGGVYVAGSFIRDWWRRTA